MHLVVSDLMIIRVLFILNTAHYGACITNMIEEEGWGYLNDWEPDQLRKKRTKICMCCDHFRYACTAQCVTLLTCPVHQKLIPQGDHLIKGCKYWAKRRELREGWCPEVA